MLIAPESNHSTLISPESIRSKMVEHIGQGNGFIERKPSQSKSASERIKLGATGTPDIGEMFLTLLSPL